MVIAQKLALLEVKMLIMRYPRVDMFEPLQVFPEVYVDVSDFAMDPILSALDKVMEDERLLLLAWNDWITRRPNCLKTRAAFDASRSLASPASSAALVRLGVSHSPYSGEREFGTAPVHARVWSQGAQPCDNE